MKSSDEKPSTGAPSWCITETGGGIGLIRVLFGIASLPSEQSITEPVREEAIVTGFGDIFMGRQ